MSLENDEKEEGNNGKKNILEWTIFGISLLLVIAVLCFLVYKTVTHQSSPPDVLVTFTPSPSENTPYRYHLTIQNIGGETAEDVLIELVLRERGQAIEKSEVQLPFVPQGSKIESWVNFINDPALADSVLAKVVSFKRP
ncbi:MAG: hypothetical protein WD555_05230 [Fulvivirga sp.]